MRRCWHCRRRSCWRHSPAARPLPCHQRRGAPLPATRPSRKHLTAALHHPTPAFASTSRVSGDMSHPTCSSTKQPPQASSPVLLAKHQLLLVLVLLPRRSLRSQLHTQRCPPTPTPSLLAGTPVGVWSPQILLNAFPCLMGPLWRGLGSRCCGHSQRPSQLNSRYTCEEFSVADCLVFFFLTR